jgi:streptogramin lyase
MIKTGVSRATPIMTLAAALITLTPTTAMAATPTTASPPPAVGLREFTLPTTNSGPTAITVGRHGEIWFTEGNANKIGKINKAGRIREFELPTAGCLS